MWGHCSEMSMIMTHVNSARWSLEIYSFSDWAVSLWWSMLCFYFWHCQMGTCLLVFCFCFFLIQLIVCSILHTMIGFNASIINDWTGCNNLWKRLCCVIFPISKPSGLWMHFKANLELLRNLWIRNHKTLLMESHIGPRWTPWSTSLVVCRLQSGPWQRRARSSEPSARDQTTRDARARVLSCRCRSVTDTVASKSFLLYCSLSCWYGVSSWLTNHE